MKNLVINMSKFQTPRGMRDLTNEDLRYFDKIRKKCGKVAEFCGFKRIEPPILESTELFKKGTGSNTEIVQKQMYNLKTKGGKQLTLRPEGTPSVVRAYLERGMESLPKPVKLWYFGPFFRHERPQAGRYRQLHQFGFESIGSESWIVDAQIILMFYTILEDLGLKNLVIEINSIGDRSCRPHYNKILLDFLKKKQRFLCPDCKRRLKTNPLRIFDCKNEKCQEIVNQAPQTLNYLCKDCHKHFKNVLETLDELQLPYNLNPYLVRGLDYYTRTVFEIISGSEENEGSLVGGGRYDELVELLGGNETPACGGAAGIERIVSLMKKEGKKMRSLSKANVFLAQVGKLPKRKALILMEEFRKAKIKIVESLHKNSLSTQLKRAGNLGIRYVLIMAQKEILDNKIILKDMKTGKQKKIPIDKVVKEIKKKVK